MKISYSVAGVLDLERKIILEEEVEYNKGGDEIVDRKESLDNEQDKKIGSQRDCDYIKV